MAVNYADPASPLRLAVVGVGHFGQIHAQKLAGLPGVRLVAIADVDGARAASVAESLGVRAVTDHRELFGAVDAVTVAVPTRAHGEVAADFLMNGIDVLIEKPIAHDPAVARQLVDLADSRRRILQVGHLERYSGLVEALGRHAVAPRYIESLRIAPFKARSTDVNVIMDMMIHDIDLLLCLVGAPLVNVDATGAAIFSDSEDIASVRLRFGNGCVANVVASRVSLKTERQMRLFESGRYLAVDLGRHSIRMIRQSDIQDPYDPAAYTMREESYAEVDALEREFLAFIAAVRSRETPAVDGRAGLRALEAAQRITDSIRGLGAVSRASRLPESAPASPRPASPASPRETPAARTAPSSPPGLPLVDLRAQYAVLKPAIDAAVAQVVASGQFVAAPLIAELEDSLARLGGAAAAVCVNSGTDALRIPLMAAGIGPGDAVFVPSYTFVATAEVVASLGAEPVFVDVDEGTFTMDPHALARAVWLVSREERLRPRAVIAVDLFGRPADYQALGMVADEHDLLLVADAAQSFGGAIGNRPVGALAEVTATSFYPSKPLGCYGDGGCIFAMSEAAAASLRRIRQHGFPVHGGDDAVVVGLNSRLDTIQAAVLKEKLRIFPDELRRREDVAGWYRQRLADKVRTPEVTPAYRSTWAVYCILTPARDRVQAALADAGIAAARYYDVPVHRQAAYRRYGAAAGSLPVTERLCRESLALPIHAYLREQDVDRICAVIDNALA